MAMYLLGTVLHSDKYRDDGQPDPLDVIPDKEAAVILIRRLMMALLLNGKFDDGSPPSDSVHPYVQRVADANFQRYKTLIRSSFPSTSPTLLSGTITAKRLKARRIRVGPEKGIEGELWSWDTDPDVVMVKLLSVQEMESCLPAWGHTSVEEFDKDFRIYLSLEPTLHEYCSSSRRKKSRWEERKAKPAKLDMAVEATLRLCGDVSVILAIGNGSFNDGCKLTSK
ncbi:hypothetical protein BGX33_011260 [Mortierella sp. NVP41]|nr:hypothetical protein BGX33_011260 [Mortierella sp. NVP41]